MIDFFPGYEIDNLTPDKQNITLEHMLTMSTGLEWYEMEYSYGDKRNSYYQWVRSDERVQYVLDLPMTAVPGADYNYNTGVSHLLERLCEDEERGRSNLTNIIFTILHKIQIFYFTITIIYYRKILQKIQIFFTPRNVIRKNI